MTWNLFLSRSLLFWISSLINSSWELESLPAVLWHFSSSPFKDRCSKRFSLNEHGYLIWKMGSIWWYCRKGAEASLSPAAWRNSEIFDPKKTLLNQGKGRSNLAAKTCHAPPRHRFPLPVFTPPRSSPKSYESFKITSLANFHGSAQVTSSPEVLSP